MVHFVLSVLLMGMLPVADSSDMQLATLRSLPIAAPSLVMESSGLERSLDANLSASGVLISDLDSGQEIYGRNVSTERAIASLAKLMTASIIVPNHSLDEVVEVPQDIGMVEGQVAHLKPGEHYTVGTLLSAMLVYSANDAAVTLAMYHSGTVGAFVAAMNARAKELGLHDTSFANPIGLDDPAEYSTPQDLKWLATFALRLQPIADRMAMPTVTIRSLEGNTETLRHTHEMLHQPSSIIMGKTGTTDEAEECLFSVVSLAGRKYMVVLLGSSERYRDMRIVLRALTKLTV